MPHIIVVAEGEPHADGHVMLRERINPSDLESKHFARQLIERLGWAVEDAEEAERNVQARRPPKSAQRSASVVTTAS